MCGNEKKPGTGAPLHTKEPVTVASFRTWRGWRENGARDRWLTFHSIKRGCPPRRPSSQFFANAIVARLGWLPALPSSVKDEWGTENRELGTPFTAPPALLEWHRARERT